MTATPFDQLACPLDGERLSPHDNAWKCAQGHSFDVARQGYIHLLPVQKKKTLNPGDSKDMVAARRRFLEQGFYDPISDAVNQAVASFDDGAEVLRCLDAGCGEGYYLCRLARDISSGRSCQFIGNDISKWAVLKAAQKEKQTVRWVVATNANLPIQTGTLNCILSLFGFPVYSEFGRVLSEGGVVIQVDAGPDHLLELREIIYPELKPTGEKAPEPEGFERVSEQQIRFPLALESKENIMDLLAMTPHLYRASAEGIAKAGGLDSIVVTVDAVLRVFRKTGSFSQVVQQ